MASIQLCRSKHAVSFNTSCLALQHASLGACGTVVLSCVVSRGQLSGYFASRNELCTFQTTSTTPHDETRRSVQCGSMGLCGLGCTEQHRISRTGWTSWTSGRPWELIDCRYEDHPGQRLEYRGLLDISHGPRRELGCPWTCGRYR